jgi:glc operon protein GlcG
MKKHVMHNRASHGPRMSSIAAMLGLALSLRLAVAGDVNGSKTLTLEGARKVIAAAEAYADEKKAAGSIAVVDEGGHLLCLVRRDGSFAASARVAYGKAHTAALFKKPTRDFENSINNGRYAMTAMEDFTPLQGGIPIVADGIVVGAIGVSGAASAQQDEEVALAGAAALASQQK